MRGKPRERCREDAADSEQDKLTERRVVRLEVGVVEQREPECEGRGYAENDLDRGARPCTARFDSETHRCLLARGLRERPQELTEPMYLMLGRQCQ